MKLPVIKKLVENFSLEDLQNAEIAILDGKHPLIQIDGDDEGEQLTHVMAASWIKQDLEVSGNLAKSMRNYTQKVRSSID